MAYYADEFDMNELWEVVALSGVHTLGGAEANNSAHDGVFTEINQEVAFNNNYFKIALDNGTVWSQGYNFVSFILKLSCNYCPATRAAKTKRLFSIA